MSHSVFRGYGEGIGEGPGRPAPPGEQYLYACPEIWRDPALADAMRPWLTVDFEPVHRNDRGSRLEVWSCFRMKDYQFIARGVVVGAPNGGKPHYFTHARAWRDGTLENHQDPGALLGVSGAFQPPARSPSHSNPPAFAMTWSDLLRAERESATRLLAQVFAARLASRPVVVWASPELLAGGLRLTNMLAFVRAALPLALKHGFHIRTYTRKPEVFLQELGAGLVVVLSFDAEKAMKACPRAMLLASDGHPMDPADLASDAYAKAVVGRALEFPQQLFEFSANFRPEFPTRAASVVYNFSAVRENGNLLDELLEYIYRRQVPADIPLPWGEIIPAATWSHFGGDMLRKLALTPPLTIDGKALEPSIRRELRRRKLLLDADLSAPANRHLVENPSFMLGLLADSLITSSEAPNFIGHISSAELLQFLTDDRLCAALIAATDENPVPESWRPAIYRSPDAYTVALRILTQARAGPTWQAEAYHLLESLIIEGREIPVDFPQESQAFPEPPSMLSALIITELIYRATCRRAGNKGLREFDVLRVAGLDRFQDHEHRSWLLQQLRHAQWTCLTAFSKPASWTDGASGLPAPSDIGGMDQAMLRRQRETTALLVAGGQWLAWRKASKLPPDKLREAGIAWLLDPATNRSWDEWKIVMKDIDKLAEHRIRKLCDVRRPPWPWVPGHEVEQMNDLLALASNHDARAALCDLDPRIAEAYARSSSSAVPGASASVGVRDAPVSPKSALPLRRTVTDVSFRTVTAIEEFSAEILQWLAEPSACESSWESVEPESLRSVAQRIRTCDGRLWNQLRANGCTVFKQQCRRNPNLLQPCGGVLPALEVMAVLRSGESIASIAWELIELSSPAYLEMPSWWSALLAGLEDMPRRSGQPYQGPSALQTIVGMERRLSEPAKKAFLYAREHHLPEKSKTAATPLNPEPYPAVLADLAKPAERATETMSATSVQSNSRLADDVLQALARGDASAPCWRDLDHAVAAEELSLEHHPWLIIARRAGRGEAVAADALKKNAWNTLRRVLPAHEVLMQMPRMPKGQLAAAMPLPARTAVVAVRPGVGLEDVVGDLVLMDLNSRQLELTGWWKGLLHGLPADAIRSLSSSLTSRLRLRQREAMFRACKIIE